MSEEFYLTEIQRLFVDRMVKYEVALAVRDYLAQPIACKHLIDENTPTKGLVAEILRSRIALGYGKEEDLV